MLKGKKFDAFALLFVMYLFLNNYKKSVQSL